MILMLRCDGASRLLSDTQDRRLHFAERLALIGHLLSCVWCRRYRAQLDHLVRFAAQLNSSRAASPPAFSTKLSAAAKERIRRSIVEAMDRPSQ
jgi:hypothetical protein